MTVSLRVLPLSKILAAGAISWGVNIFLKITRQRFVQMPIALGSNSERLF
jgi:hypothetical protein